MVKGTEKPGSPGPGAAERVARRVRLWRTARRRRVGVALLGGERVTDLLGRAYLATEGARLSAVHGAEPGQAQAWAAGWARDDVTATADLDRILADPAVEGVEVACPLARRAETAIAALRAGKHVSVLKPLARTLDEAERVLEAARGAKGCLRVNDPLVFYPPYRKAKDLVESLEIGEPSTIRIKSNLAGHGGWGPDLGAEHASVAGQLFHPCFDKFALAAWLFGPPVQVMAYLNELDPVRGGASIVLWKGRAEGRYGVLENVYSPDMRVRSSYYPCDETIEISGMDGLIWVTRCTARMTEEAPIVVRKGRSYTQIGVECGLPADWSEAFRASARHFVGSILDGRAPGLTGDEGRDALRFLLAAGRSAGMRTPADV